MGGGHSGRNRLTMRGVRGETVSRRRGESQTDEYRDWKRGEGGCDAEGAHAICLDVEEKTVDGFNYG